ncbi:hypothetical protein PMAYCL1PPCAC_28382, partial [Pristionchus mayeri]
MLRKAVAFAVLLSYVRCCTVPREKGFSCDGKHSAMRFYHDAKSGRCQPFFFLGCGGNENNFANREECERKCHSSLRTEQDLPRNQTFFLAESACSLPTSAVLQEQAMACRTTADCAAGHTCSSSGHCCPTRDHICSLPTAWGNEPTEFHRIGRFAWMDSLKNCIKFRYFGLNGNANNFDSYKECIDFCG